MVLEGGVVGCAHPGRPGQVVRQQREPGRELRRGEFAAIVELGAHPRRPVHRREAKRLDQLDLPVIVGVAEELHLGHDVRGPFGVDLVGPLEDPAHAFGAEALAPPSWVDVALTLDPQELRSVSAWPNACVDGQHAVDEAADAVLGSRRRVVHLLVQIALVVVLAGLVDQFGVRQQGRPSRHVVMGQVSPLHLLVEDWARQKIRSRGHPNAGAMTSFRMDETSAGAS